MYSTDRLLLLSAFFGFTSHHFVFRHGEWHMQAPLLLRSAVLGSSIILLTTIYLEGSTEGFFNGTTIVSVFHVSLFTSILVYRTFFHRLNGFPGPIAARATKFWHVWKCIQSSSQNYLVLDGLHKKYGDFVRTGPNEVTVFHPDIISAMDGPGNACTKAVWYDFLLPEVAVNTTRDKAKHDKRRRIWDRGFSAKALIQYQTRIAEYAQRLDQALEKQAIKQNTIHFNSWAYWYSFDVMGEFAFARSFGMLQNEEWHYAIVLLRRAMSLLGPLSPVPWLAQIGFWLMPNLWVVKDWNFMMRWCKKRMHERCLMQPERTDVSSYLIDASQKADSMEEDRHWLNGDAIAIIIAGSDTVAPTLVYIFYELAKHSKQQNKLRAELSTIDVSDHKSLQKLQHLNAIINETLRLHPAVPSGGYRETPTAGINVAGTYIPGGTTLVAPRYTIGRLESCFDQPNDFIPERWYETPELIKSKKGFSPFSLGRYSCVGKNLALAELRYVTALLVSKYVILFAEGENGVEVERDMRDQFTAAPGDLKLRFLKS